MSLESESVVLVRPWFAVSPESESVRPVRPKPAVSEESESVRPVRAWVRPALFVDAAWPRP